MWWRATLVAAALLVALAPVPRRTVEAYYSTWLFPILQHGMTGLSNRVGFALLDLLIVVAGVWWVGALMLDMASRRSFPRVFGRLLLRTITLAAFAYLAFALLWGVNYRREPITARLAFDEGAITPAASRELARRTVDELNALHVAAHAELALGGGGSGRRLETAFAGVQQGLAIQRPALPGRPKRTLLDPYFRAAGVEGMIDPFFLEILVAGGLLPFEQPFVIAHEWSHLAGFTDEGEANFVGWLTCLRASEAARYSGWLFLYGHALAALPPGERSAAAARLQPGPRADLAAIAARVKRQVQPRVSDAGWRVYDQYLKANRVEAGTGSYAEVVRLVLGSRDSGLF